MIAKIEEESKCRIEICNEEEIERLEELVYDMYLNEKKENGLTTEEYCERVAETVCSIINNEHESSFVDEDYLVVYPKNGLGSVEIPIKHIDITL